MHKVEHNYANRNHSITPNWLKYHIRLLLLPKIILIRGIKTSHTDDHYSQNYHEVQTAPDCCFEITHISYHVSKLLNFLVTTLPKSIPSRSTILWARSGCDVPLKTLIFGILLRSKQLGFSKFARIKLLARTGSDTTGITAKTSHTTNQITAEKDIHHIPMNVFYWATVVFSWWESNVCLVFKIRKSVPFRYTSMTIPWSMKTMSKITDHHSLECSDSAITIRVRFE